MGVAADSYSLYVCNVSAADVTGSAVPMHI